MPMRTPSPLNSVHVLETQGRGELSHVCPWEGSAMSACMVSPADGWEGWDVSLGRGQHSGWVRSAAGLEGGNARKH